MITEDEMYVILKWGSIDRAVIEYCIALLHDRDIPVFSDIEIKVIKANMGFVINSKNGN